jgi:hypothetical protein
MLVIILKAIVVLLFLLALPVLVPVSEPKLVQGKAGAMIVTLFRKHFFLSAAKEPPSVASKRVFCALKQPRMSYSAPSLSSLEQS